MKASAVSMMLFFEKIVKKNCINFGWQKLILLMDDSTFVRNMSRDV